MGWVVWLGIFKDILFISFIIHIIDFFLFSPAGHFPTLVRSAPGRGTYLPPLWGRWEDEVYLAIWTICPIFITAPPPPDHTARISCHNQRFM